MRDPIRSDDSSRRPRHDDGCGNGRGSGGRRGEGGRRGNGHGRRRGARAQRGDVRAAVLQLLGEEPMHGYQLMQRITESSHGAWRPSPGSMYPVLAQLEDEGLVEFSHGHGRKLAALTEAGQAYVTEHANELATSVAALRDEIGDQVDLREPVDELAAAARQLARSGSPAQQEQARKVLRETRRSLYLILANDDDLTDASADQ
jgi:DNA-binding PadR family transcriptional regulator